MAAAEPNVLSTNESDFLLSALAEGLRVDGRYLLERRRVRRVCRLSVIALPGPTLSAIAIPGRGPHGSRHLCAALPVSRPPGCRCTSISSGSTARCARRSGSVTHGECASGTRRRQRGGAGRGAGGWSTRYRARCAAHASSQPGLHVPPPALLVCSVLAVLTAQVSPPFPDRPTEGLLALNVEVPAMAGPGYEVRVAPAVPAPDGRRLGL